MTSDAATEPAADAVITVEHAERSGVARLAKSIAATLFYVYVLPRRIALTAARAIFGEDRAFLQASESIARTPGARGLYSRSAFYRRTLAACGDDVYFGWMSTFSKARSTVGDRVYIGRRCGVGYAEIDDDVMLSDGVQVLSGGRQHGTAGGDLAFREQRQTFTRVAIGRGAWIGTGAVVMADVGEGSIVGAGAVVVTPIPPRTVAAGVPAKVLRRLE